MNDHPPVIDLRSDTVTQPTAAMRAAMAQAELGDDVYGEDPTVNRLEALAAEMLGKEAAVFVSSGTMGNLISVLAHCGRGDEMLVGDRAHIFLYEQGGSAALGGVHPRTLPNQPDGTLALDQIRDNIRGDDEHFPVTRLICLENTHNRCGGAPLAPAYVEEVADLAQERGLQLHMDGARLWNAAVALNRAPADLVRRVDSVSCCLSKGLAAPVGSVVAGRAAFIQRARRMRKIVGGGMRQAGVLAAAGVISLTDMVERLADDHDNAQTLAQGLADIPGLAIDADAVTTNIVYFKVVSDRISPVQLAAGLQDRHILMNPIDGATMRAVLNCDVSASDIARALQEIAAVMAEGPSGDTARVRTYG